MGWGQDGVGGVGEAGMWWGVTVCGLGWVGESWDGMG